MKKMLDGELGSGTQIAAEMITALAKIYDADGFLPVKSSQISGVSYKNIGEAGIEFLESLRSGDARARVRATLNPCGLDLDSWRELGFPEAFYRDQARVLDAYNALGIEMTCSCTPYLLGNCPAKGDHVAWSESSAISYANSVLGAMTNREGGPSALASALTGFTGNFGLHLEKNRIPRQSVVIRCNIESYLDFGTLGLMLGKKLGQDVPFITGLKKEHCTPENLRQLGAAMAASGAVALYHVDGVTPEAKKHAVSIKKGEITIPSMEISELDEIVDVVPAKKDVAGALKVDMVFLGCPHYSRQDVMDILEGLRGKKLHATLWIATARTVKKSILEDTDLTRQLDPRIKIVSDTCIVVCPIDALGIKSVVTNSGKAYFYLKNNESLAVVYRDTQACIESALSGTVAIGRRT